MAADVQPDIPVWNRWHFWRRSSMLCALCFALGLLVLDNAGALLIDAADDLLVHDHREAALVRVLDDGLIEIDAPDSLQESPVTRLRILGIAMRDDPETAAARLEQLLREAERFTIHLEPHRTRDASGNLLAHLRLPDNRSVAAILLAEGVASCDEHWPHAHLIEYAQLEQAARLRGLGFWSGRSKRAGRAASSAADSVAVISTGAVVSLLIGLVADHVAGDGSGGCAEAGSFARVA